MSRIIEWFVGNPVASNLLMLILIVAGTASLVTLRQEEFPSIDTDVIRVSVEYPGSSPEENEESVCVRIEEAIESVIDIDEISSIAVEGACVVSVVMVIGADIDEALNEVQNRVDSIDTFPVETEKPIISKVIMRQAVMRILITGDIDERSLKVLGEQARNELILIPGISQVNLEYDREYEISIEVSEETLRRHELTLSRIADVIRSSSLDLPGGSVKTGGGEILLRSVGQAYSGSEFEDIVVLTQPDGTSIRLGEIAKIIDGFEDSDVSARFNESPAVMLLVERVGEEDTLDIADLIDPWIEDFRSRMPEGVELVTSANAAQDLRIRLDALNSNAIGGLLLVVLILALFLRFRLAMWVAAGVPISLLGAIALFGFFDITISTLSVMAFILVLGILVDDAIVVGESIYTRELKMNDQIQAAILGTRDVYVPVTFGVLTSVAAFIPLTIIPGRMGAFFGTIGDVAILCLLFSLVESQWILPGHLAHRKTTPGDKANEGSPGRWSRFQNATSSGFEKFSLKYAKILERAMAWRYATAAIAIGIVIVTLSVLTSGRLRYQFFPAIEGNVVHASLTMPRGIPIHETEAAVEVIREAAAEMGRELEQDADSGVHVLYTISSIGKQLARDGPPDLSVGTGGGHLGEVMIEMNPASERRVQAFEIADRWRQKVGPIPGAVELKFSGEAFSSGDAINIELGGGDMDSLRAVSVAIQKRLSSYDGVSDVSDSFRAGKQEVSLSLRPEARPLGITQADLARQVRQAFYGEEVQRVQRGRDDMKVMLRYPEEERHSLGALEQMRIRLNDGTELPFSAVAEAKLGRGFATIRRTDRRRVVEVTAEVDRQITTPEKVLGDIQPDIDEILSGYPGVEYKLGGEQRDVDEARDGLIFGFGLTLLLIFALLAVPLKSYLQPFIIMAVIPFGAVGAIVGHMIMSWDLVFFSILGIVALSGVVVNASLVLVHKINSLQDAGLPMVEAVRQAAVIRFRPILLTSMTTFFGLVPLMFEPSISAKPLVPMAISLAYGVLFASVVTLFLVPCGYLILDDFRRNILRQKGGEESEEEPGSNGTNAEALTDLS
ncbi:MAG: efflux RND transporter permease subunit [Myxococcota bacterium]|nr:efflux RND transporter permease subunit [Myxococcota bacterium]